MQKKLIEQTAIDSFEAFHRLVQAFSRDETLFRGAKNIADLAARLDQEPAGGIVFCRAWRATLHH